MLRGDAARLASACSMPCSGMGSGPGAPSRSQASVHAVRSWRAGLPVIDRRAHGVARRRGEQLLQRPAAACPPRRRSARSSRSTHPARRAPAPRPSGGRCRCRRRRAPGRRDPTASTTSGTSTIVEISPQWPPASVPCATMMSTPLLDLLLRVARRAHERADQHAVLVGGVDDLLRRRAERVHEQLHVGCLERDLDLHRALGRRRRGRRRSCGAARPPSATAARRARAGGSRRSPCGSCGIIASSSSALGCLPPTPT